MPTETQCYLELTGSTLHAVRANGATIEAFRECHLENKPAVEEVLTELKAGWKTEGIRSVSAVTSATTDWHVTSAEQAARLSTEEAVRTFAAGLPAGVKGPFDMAGCQTETGVLIAPSGSARWVLAITPTEILGTSTAIMTDWKVENTKLESVTLSRLGGISAALKSAEIGAVALLELGLEKSHVFLVSRKGVEAVVPCLAGYNDIFTSVQAALNLKFRGAAGRLFFNESYDFTETGPKIAATLGAALKTSLSQLPGGVVTPTLACVGLTGKQAWFVKEVAAAAGITPWEPDIKKLAEHLQLKFNDGVEPSLSSTAVGLLHQTASQARKATSWHPSWSKSAAVVAAPAPAAVAPVAPPRPAPPPAKPAEPAKPVAKAPEAPKPAPQPVKPAPAPVPLSKPAAKAPEAPKPVEQPKKPEPAKPEPKPAAPAPKPVEKPAPAPAPVPARPASYGPKSKSKMPMVIIGVVLAIAVLGGGFFFLQKQKSDQAAEVQRKHDEEAAQAAAKAAADAAAKAQAQLQEMQKQRDDAIAKMQAEENAKRQAAEAERIAKSPGTVIITSLPTGADVSFDSSLLTRKTPLTANDIPGGPHQVHIALSGYTTVTLPVEVKGGKTVDLGTVKLENAVGILAVTSTPPGVDFAVGISDDLLGQPVREGKTPATFNDLPEGRYVVTFKRPGWADRHQDAIVSTRSTEAVTCKYSTGSIVIESTPSGATVFKDGTAIGATPLTLSDQDPGKVSFVLTLPDFDDLIVGGDLGEGQTLKLSSELLRSDRIAKNSEIKVPPQSYESPEPRLTAADRRGGNVTLSVVVAKDGSVSDVQVEKTTDDQLAQRCVEAVIKWKFHPAIGLNDKPVNFRVRIPFVIPAAD